MRKSFMEGMRRRMKKNIVKILLSCMVIMNLTACANQETKENTKNKTEAVQENTTIYFEDIDVDKYVTLGQYKGLEVSRNPKTITEDEIQGYIDYMLSMSAQLIEVEDRDVVENGDVTMIDFVGKKDGVAFEGGTAYDYELTIGSGAFIPGFEEGLIGVKVGETVDLDLTFPEDYSAEELAGVPVVFSVTVQGIYEKQTPEFNDEYIASLGMEDISTTEDYRKYITEMLKGTSEESILQELKTDILNLAYDNAQVTEVPQVLVDKYIESSENSAEYQASMYGMELEEFLETVFGMDLETFEEEIKVEAELSAKQALVCVKIAKEENIEVTDEELKTYMESSYAIYGYESLEDFETKIDKEEYRDSMLLNEVVDFLLENAVVSDTETVQ